MLPPAREMPSLCPIYAEPQRHDRRLKRRRLSPPLALRAPAARKKTERRWIGWLALALVGGYLLFCHGCHGDEDNELFTASACAQASRVASETLS
jgi:hypothetical protein